jgi:hypothetical protein
MVQGDLGGDSACHSGDGRTDGNKKEHKSRLGRRNGAETPAQYIHSVQCTPRAAITTLENSGLRAAIEQEKMPGITQP